MCGDLEESANPLIPYSSVPADALALASRIFVYDPAKRPSAEEVLSDPYFTNEPLPERTTAYVFIPHLLEHQINIY